MYQVTDQLGQTLSFDKPPERVVSLVPSVTYLLHHLALENNIIGITQFCKLPKHYKKDKTLIGGTKEVKLNRVEALKPDLFILSKEENTKELAENLSQIAPVFVSDVYNCQSNIELIRTLGIVFQKTSDADKLLDRISLEKQRIIKRNQGKQLKTLYFIWQNPWMSVGRDTFINQMMQLAGFDNILANQKRYPTVDLSKINPNDVDVILLSSEPFPFKEKHKTALQKQFPNTKILLVKGEPFTWFGAYPKEAFSYFTQLQKELTNAY